MIPKALAWTCSGVSTGFGRDHAQGMCVSGRSNFVRCGTGSKTAADFSGGANDRPSDPLEDPEAMAGLLDADCKRGINPRQPLAVLLMAFAASEKP
jgi:hypothetical protein